jgi:alpha-D-ribose 1-methylphosphonate 5-triphosphate diphosphatase
MLSINGGSALLGTSWAPCQLNIEEGVIQEQRAPTSAALEIDATGLLALPGVIDIHGDAFERSIMPRPGVCFDLHTALRDVDNQLVSNGVTTAFHGITCSWEPGLRSLANTVSMLDALNEQKVRFRCDMRVHLRHEVFNLEAEPSILEWLAMGRIQALAFNDHMRGIVLSAGAKSKKIKQMAERAGLADQDFMVLIEQVMANEGHVSDSIARLAAAARKHGVPLLSHDDRDLMDRETYRALGCEISEFPMQEEVATAAIAAGEMTVFGAPNVLRGGSHIGCPSAAEMAQKGLCSILASDYYYPAILQAPFMLAQRGLCSLAQAWALVSSNPARAMGLSDRGSLEPGKRADLVLVESNQGEARLVATICGGELAWLGEPGRLRASRGN